MKSMSSKAQESHMRNGMRGFTLIELMIVVVVIGILAAIAYPSFQEQVRKSKRADGKAALMETAQRLERCYTRFAGYNAGCGVAAEFDSSEGHYKIAVDSTASTFELTATPQGDQAKDRCANLTLAHDGIQGASGADADECW